MDLESSKTRLTRRAGVSSRKSRWRATRSSGTSRLQLPVHAGVPPPHRAEPPVFEALIEPTLGPGFTTNFCRKVCHTHSAPWHVAFMSPLWDSEMSLSLRCGGHITYLPATGSRGQTPRSPSRTVHPYAPHWRLSRRSSNTILQQAQSLALNQEHLTEGGSLSLPAPTPNLAPAQFRYLPVVLLCMATLFAAATYFGPIAMANATEQDFCTHAWLDRYGQPDDNCAANDKHYNYVIQFWAEEHSTCGSVTTNTSKSGLVATWGCTSGAYTSSTKWVSPTILTNGIIRNNASADTNHGSGKQTWCWTYECANG